MTVLTKEEWEELVVDVRSHLLPRKQAEIFDQIVERLGGTLPTCCIVEPTHVTITFETANTYLDIFFDTANGKIEWLWGHNGHVESLVHPRAFSAAFWQKLDEFIGTTTPEVAG